ncbi:DUF418 domain-containing protein [Bacillus sp. 1P06AnD]|uniref:DUF418 domain-containing protein n=1 Tax=Bacillus sp. 1P06AnD TaxID=3132208 RepID=UPI0039A2CED4
MEHRLGAIGEQDRIISLDILRGMALLGILFVNMPFFFSPALYLNPDTYWGSGIDHYVQMAVTVFAQSSFYPLFAFLFGFGAMLMSERIAQKKISFHVLFLKRLGILFFIGTIHAFLIWHGDILITYAICGIFLLLFLGKSGRGLLMTGTLAYLVVWGLLLAGTGLAELTGLEANHPDELLYNSEEAAISEMNYQNGSFLEIFQQRLKDWNTVNDLGNYWLLVLNILPLMLLGAGCAKKGWIARVEENRGMLLLLGAVGFMSGLVCKALPYFWTNSYSAMFLQTYFGGPLLSLFYLTAILLLLQNRHMRRLLHPFAYVGRMSMSNYLLQSVVCTTIFYSYGFGLYGRISYSTGVLILIVLFALQVFLSRFWLFRFRQGPIEYMWRWGTYGKRPVFKREEVQ